MLVDSFGRTINYIRLSVTEHCNYKCTYCREEDHQIFSKKEEILSYEEIGRIIAIFATLGVHKVRLTGGEPLLRKDIDLLAQTLHNIKGITQIPISTNAHLLDIWAQKLYDNGVHTANISLDSIEPDKFYRITRGGDVAKVIRSIKIAQSIGMKVKLNMVVMAGMNTDEIISMFEFARSNNLELRYIETMPIGSAGVKATTRHYTKKDILAEIAATYGNITPVGSTAFAGPASLYTLGKYRFGVISAISDEFCSSCNRVRITTKGKLILCLGQENAVDLKALIDANTSDDGIKQAIIHAINKKPEKHFFNSDLTNIDTRQMVEIGG